VTGGGEDDSLTVPADVEKPLPYIDGHLSAIDALHQGCYEEWVEKMPDEYMDKVDSILSDDSSGVRGSEEIERRREKAYIRINNLYKTDAKIEREDIIEETLDWVLGERDDL
jgi:hypothetical protein